MKWMRIAVAIMLLAAAFSIIRYYRGNTLSPSFVASTPTPTIVSKESPQRTAVFVPYWGLGGGLPTEYDRLLYFGVTPGENGINTSEIGYQSLDNFVSQVPNGVKTYLTLRMLDNQKNFSILENTSSQKRIINQTVLLAKRNNFDGIVLDLELKALPFDSLLKQINGFMAEFHKEAKRQGLQLAVTQYGDTFYRVRPFDVSVVAKNSDEVMIMAYDFHKAGGNPGPNFPLNGRDTYGYDFKEMVEGFSKVVPKEKLTIIFGYFGYDWPTDGKEKATNIGAAFSLLDINRQYLEGCGTCVVTRDPASTETKVTYTSGDNIPHVVWFEDTESIKKKQEYLKSVGLSSYAYWAYSYF